MVKVRVYLDLLTDMYTIIGELKASGLILHNDFDYAYTPPYFDYITDHKVRRFVDFIFYEEKYATLFTIKYANNE